MHILVIGCGSIGKRHLGNLRQIGVETLSAVDLRQDRLNEAAQAAPGLRQFTSVADALAQPDLSGAIVCPSTAYHVPIGLQVAQRGLNFMMEKPLSHTREGLDDLQRELRRNGNWLMVAYSLRFYPGIMKVRQLLDGKAIGRVLSVRAECGQYLPDWHPWEDYRSWYMSKEAQGGGAILDISHEIDYLRWFFGEVDSLAASVGKVTDLELDTDDMSEVLLQFRNGVVGSLHLDLAQRAYRRTCLIVGTEGTIWWDYAANVVQLYTAQAGQWETLPYHVERNEQFVAEAKHFLACLRGEAKPPVDFDGGRRTLEVVLAAKQASRERRWVALYPRQ